MKCSADAMFAGTGFLLKLISWAGLVFKRGLVFRLILLYFFTDAAAW